MRSFKGIVASIIFLSLLPIAVVYQMLFDKGIEAVTHGWLAAGSILISLAVFDFKTPQWILWTGFASAAGLGIIFILQGVSLLVPDERLFYLSFTVLGQNVERLLVDLYIVWCAGMLLTHSKDKEKLFGFFAVALMICLEIYLYVVSFFNGIPEESLKLLYFLLFIWLYLESKKRTVIACPGTAVVV